MVTKTFLCLIFLILTLVTGAAVEAEQNDTNSTSTEIAITPSSNSSHLRAKRQWPGCGFGGCGNNGNPICGANGCSFGCSGSGCGGFGGYGGYGRGGGCGCCAGGCGQMCCQNRQPRPCVNCGAQYRCCPCCMPACSQRCVRGGGCFCDYDYGGAWGRKRRHALDFDRPNTTEIVDFEA